MSSDVENAAEILGHNIMTERKNRGLSQYELADGICSQSMISSIEKGHYIPNAILLAQLCNKLGISVHNAMLNSYFGIGKFKEDTKVIENLCNHHKYDELIEFMDNSNILDQLYSNEDFQKYYYYYGCGLYQLTGNAKISLRFLKMALLYTYSNNKEINSPIELLLLSVINFIEAKSKKFNNVDDTDIKKTINCILSEKYTIYNQNLNVVFYQYALILFHEKQYIQSIKILTNGIQWITNNESTYMLSDLYFLLSHCYSKINNKKEEQKANNNADVLSKIFKQTINKNI